MILLVPLLVACSTNAPRRYVLHAPACSAPCAPRPLLLVLPGLGQTAANAEAFTNFDYYADIDHFVVAYPQGLSTNVVTTGGSWNAGTGVETGPTQCCAAATADDVTWLAGLPGQINKAVPIDLKRVYIAGFSAGAMMAWKSVCQRPDVFAAAEVVGGALLTSCKTTLVHVLHAHDPINDCIVPYYGGFTCGGRPTPALPTRFPNSSLEPTVVRAGSVVQFHPLSDNHVWPLTVVNAPDPRTAALLAQTYPEHAAEFGWAFLKQWSLP
jgi:poly(3-hydroxybutyrate) depolymerase